jgi:hypothetical protein
MTHCINTGPGKENVTPNNVTMAMKKLAPTPKKAVWLTADNVVMIRVLTEQQAAGNQSDNGWKSLIWTLIAKSLQWSEVLSGGAEKTTASCSGHRGKVFIGSNKGSQYANANVRVQLKSDFLMVKTLHSLSGWGWDDTTQMVIAPLEVWDEYLKVHYYF